MQLSSAQSRRAWPAAAFGPSCVVTQCHASQASSAEAGRQAAAVPHGHASQRIGVGQRGQFRSPPKHRRIVVLVVDKHGPTNLSIQSGSARLRLINSFIHPSSWLLLNYYCYYYYHIITAAHPFCTGLEAQAWLEFLQIRSVGLPFCPLLSLRARAPQCGSRLSSLALEVTIIDCPLLHLSHAFNSLCVLDRAIR